MFINNYFCVMFMEVEINNHAINCILKKFVRTIEFWIFKYAVRYSGDTPSLILCGGTGDCQSLGGERGGYSFDAITAPTWLSSTGSTRLERTAAEPAPTGKFHKHPTMTSTCLRRAETCIRRGARPFVFERNAMQWGGHF